jgi:hypothetical protein
MQPFYKQQISKHVSTTTQLLLKKAFSILSVKSGYKEDNWNNPISWRLAVRLSSAREAEKRRRYRRIDKSSARADVTREPETVKLKNPQC